MNYTELDVFPPDHVVRIIRDGVCNEFVAYKNLLAMNFDYFLCLFKFNGAGCSESTLDLDLSFTATKLCYDLVVSKDDMTAYKNIDYELAVGVLEVYNALQCKSESFLKLFVSNLINRLDADDSVTIKKFCEKLHINHKVNPVLRNNIVMRVAYLFDGGSGLYISKTQLGTYIMSNKEPDWNTIVLVVLPRKHWTGFSWLPWSSRSEVQISYGNWFRVYNLNNLGEPQKLHTVVDNYGAVCLKGTLGLIMSSLSKKNKGYGRNFYLAIEDNTFDVNVKSLIKVKTFSSHLVGEEDLEYDQSKMKGINVNAYVKDKNMLNIFYIQYKPTTSSNSTLNN